MGEYPLLQRQDSQNGTGVCGTKCWLQISHKVLLNLSYLYENSYDCEALWLVLGDAVIGVPVRVVIDNMQLQRER